MPETVGLYNPLAILAITDQFYERAICLHATNQTLNCLTYKEGSKIPDGRSGLDHITEALGYLIMGVFPIITHSVSIQTFLI